MFYNLSDRSKAYTYMALVLVLGLGFSFIPNISSFAYMLTPAIAAMLMMLIVTRDGWKRAGWATLGLHRLGLRMWAASLIIPVAIIVLSYVMAWAASLLTLHVPRDFRGYPWSSFPIVIVITFLMNVLTSSLGEELGWRGYWLPLLASACGERRALLISGFIHGVWHVPMILIAGNYHAEQNPVLACVCIVVSTLCLGPFIGYVRLRTGSVWPASILHTAHNLAWMVMAVITTPISVSAYYISGDNSVISMLCYVGLAVWAFRRLPIAPLRQAAPSSAQRPPL
ncbi:type II CAAX prenyl endopeptidase Rce1 family protein [Paenibacillus apiarius]|uniref:CPBP family glutamic-type intramembrane protease n=1 Tax=Paenibacillus apiarius TaxID=46240 RepID=UPI003B3A4813